MAKYFNIRSETSGENGMIVKFDKSTMDLDREEGLKVTPRQALQAMGILLRNQHEAVSLNLGLLDVGMITIDVNPEKCLPAQKLGLLTMACQRVEEVLQTASRLAE